VISLVTFSEGTCRLLVQQMCRGLATIITREPWVTGHVSHVFTGAWNILPVFTAR